MNQSESVAVGCRLRILRKQNLSSNLNHIFISIELEIFDAVLLLLNCFFFYCYFVFIWKQLASVLIVFVSGNRETCIQTSVETTAFQSFIIICIEIVYTFKLIRSTNHILWNMFLNWHVSDIYHKINPVVGLVQSLYCIFISE